LFLGGGLLLLTGSQVDRQRMAARSATTRLEAEALAQAAITVPAHISRSGGAAYCIPAVVKHSGRMSTYTIMALGDGSGFNIGVAGSDGARQTILGFESEADVEAWIVQDKRLHAAANPFFAGDTSPGTGR